MTTALQLQQAVQTAIAPLFSGRSYPMAAPEEPVYPYAIIEVEAQPENTLCGRSDLTNYRYRIHVYSKSYAEMLGLRDQVMNAMGGLKAIPLFDEDVYEPEIRAMRRVMDFSVWRKE